MSCDQDTAFLAGGPESSGFDLRAFRLLLLVELALIGLTLLRPELALAASVFLLGSFLATIKPEFAFALFLTGHAIPFYVFDRVSTGIPAPVVLLLGALVASVLLRRWTDLEQTPWGVKREPVLLAALGIGLLLATGALYSPMRAEALRKVAFYFIFNLPLLALPIVARARPRTIHETLIFAYGLGVLLAILSIPVARSTPDYIRLTPTDSLNPIWFARSLGYSSVAAVYLFVRSRNAWVRMVLAITLFLFLSLMGRTMARAPFAGVLGVAVLFVFTYPSVSRKAKVSLAILTAALGLYLLQSMAPQVAARIATPVTQEASTAFRFLAWLHAAELFKAHPLTGIGTAGFYLPLPYIPLYYAHNLFLELASEVGLLGFALGVLFVVYGTRAALSVYRQAQARARREEVIAATALIGIYLYSLWNAMFSGNVVSNELVWLASGLLVAERARIGSAPNPDPQSRASAAPVPG